MAILRHGVRPPAVADGAANDPHTVSAKTIVELRSALLFMPSDDYGDWIGVGQALVGLGLVGRGLWMEWSATSPLFDPGEAAAKWKTFTGDAVSYQAVFVRAQVR